MARFERSKRGDSRRDSQRGSRDRGFSGRSREGGQGDFRRGSSQRGGRGFGGSRGFGGRSRDSGFDGHKRTSRNRRDTPMTRVKCSACGKSCEVPFKPTSSKPVYCDNCFSGKDKGRGSSGGSSGVSARDVDIINEKLNKIMHALDIE